MDSWIQDPPLSLLVPLDSVLKESEEVKEIEIGQISNLNMKAKAPPKEPEQEKPEADSFLLPSTLKELKDLCREKGLKVTGTKKELEFRLLEHAPK